VFLVRMTPKPQSPAMRLSRRKHGEARPQRMAGRR
jgi:hypothetical protein